MIHVDNLSKTFTYYEKEAGMKGSLKNLFKRKTLKKEAVKSLSFHIDKGEIVGFIGPNGAGKTTTLKMLSGILYPTGGTATVGGYVPWAREKKYKTMFSIVMGQKSQLWMDLPASDSLLLNKAIYEISDADYNQTVGELVDLLDLGELMKIQVRRLSLGERMKFELLASLLHRPRVIFLDEPTIGLDVLSQKNVRSFLSQYNKKYEATMILTSHYTKDLEALCNRAILINGGEALFDGALIDLNNFLGYQKMIRFTGALSLNEYKTALDLRLESDNGTYVMPVSEENLNETMKNLLDRPDVTGVTAEDISLDDAISLLYKRDKELI
ncbi:MAG: ATP-binding cassette domain-containing protein [Oscillospiraceae bacterium]|jgi:ABC-2 type transport system ATP-binding protein|nr:ATP-binding cassette domain-containing protein [Oscillospiraceae bacterium]